MTRHFWPEPPTQEQIERASAFFAKRGVDIGNIAAAGLYVEENPIGDEWRISYDEFVRDDTGRFIMSEGEIPKRVPRVLYTKEKPTWV